MLTGVPVRPRAERGTNQEEGIKKEERGTVPLPQVGFPIEFSWAHERSVILYRGLPSFAHPRGIHFRLFSVPGPCRCATAPPRHRTTATLWGSSLRLPPPPRRVLRIEETSFVTTCCALSFSYSRMIYVDGESSLISFDSVDAILCRDKFKKS